MYNLLKDLRVIEGASFIAGPSCCLHLLQLGAEVIRFDSIKQSPDRGRWPLVPGGRDSLYWEGLNKGKKSVALDLSRPEGREIATALITAPGENRGLFVTNYPTDSFLSHARLSKLRADLITVRVMGWSDGRPAVDYTVNAALGVPYMTGPAELPTDVPVNHVLPAWDLLTGAYAAFTLMAAERHRRATGQGQEVSIPLGDIATAALGNIGQIAEVLSTGHDRARIGNDLFGALGRDFVTQDKRRIMIVGLTSRQWAGLLKVLNITADIAAIEAELGVSFADEGLRFVHRDRILPVVIKAIAGRTYDELTPAFESAGVCWSPYRTTGEAIAAGALNETPGLFETVAHPSGCTYPTPGAAATFSSLARQPVPRAPRFGEHTDEVLTQLLGMTSGQIGKLVDDGLIHLAKASA